MDHLVVGSVLAAIATVYMAGPYLIYKALDTAALALSRRRHHLVRPHGEGRPCARLTAAAPRSSFASEAFAVGTTDCGVWQG
jgi:hypothetical protein